MADTVDWPGKSGKTYTHYIYELPYSFKDDQPGNYIFTRVESGSWIPVYIGQGDLGDRVGEGHHKWQCIKSKRATHVHAHLNKDETARLAEERDLLARHQEAYSPKGCNEA